MNDDILGRRMRDAVLGDLRPEERRKLEAELADRPGLLREYRRLSDAWEALGELRAGEPPRGARERAERAVTEAVDRAGATDRIRAAVRTGARPGTGPWPRRAAAAVVVFLAGAVTGFLARSPDTSLPRSDSPAPLGDGFRYAVIMRGAAAPEGEEAATEAMVEWARTLWSQERLVWAERLFVEGAVRLGPDPAGAERAPPPDGLFVIQASNRADAERIVRESPYLGWGGSVDVLPTTEEAMR